MAEIVKVEPIMTDELRERIRVVGEALTRIENSGFNAKTVLLLIQHNMPMKERLSQRAIQSVMRSIRTLEDAVFDD